MQERWQCSVMLAFMGGMLGQGTYLKACRPALAYTNVRLYAFPFIVFFLLAFWGKETGGVLMFALCRVVCFARWHNELCLLKLHELFSFVDTFASLDAMEQRQDSQQGSVKRPNVDSISKLYVFLQVVFLQCSAIGRARRIVRSWLGKQNVHLVYVLALHCHKLGWTLSLALAEVDVVLTCKFFWVLPSTCYLSSLMLCPTCLAKVVVFSSRILPSTYNLSSLMQCSACLARMVVFNSKILY